MPHNVTNFTKPASLAAVEEAEIQRFQREIQRLEQGTLDPDDFKRFRLENGVYGIRGYTDLHMIRVKVRFGNLTPEQLEALAEVAERYTTNQLAHVTTRQDIQVHYVKRQELPAILRLIDASGLTTREACGNTVRNVTACPYAGISPTEVFDVTPYADVVSKYFLRNPVCQNLPRKFKIAFEGCTEDHARVPIHDLGVVAKVRTQDGRSERGFQIYVGGGLGATPHVAKLLEEFTPEGLLLPSCEAVLRLYDRNGNRDMSPAGRAKARIKFLVDQWGIEEFRTRWMVERRVVLSTGSGWAQVSVPTKAEDPPTEEMVPPPAHWRPTPEYLRWKDTNVWRQKQTGYAAVLIRCPLGDVTPNALRAVAAAARTFCGGRVRTVISQNLLLRWVPEGSLPALYQVLHEAGLALASAERVADITRCPGADTCQIAITHSRGLASELSKMFNNGFASVPELQDIQIKISGCFNSCGQHHIGTIGFFGASQPTGDGHEAPVYKMLIGGRTSEGQATFGKVVAQIPAKRVPTAMQKLLTLFLKERRPQENFLAWSDRVGPGCLKQSMSEFTVIPKFAEEPELFEDLGAEGTSFKAEIGKGECAA